MSEIKDKAIDIWNAIVNFFKNLPEIIGEIFGEFVVMIVNAFLDLDKFITVTLPTIIANIVTWFAGLPDQVASAIASLPQKLVSLFSSASSSIRGVIQDIISFIASAPNSIIDFVQFMGIDNVGFQGQEFDDRVLEKISDLRGEYPNIQISVDGGVGFDNAADLISAGATRLISGSAVFESDDMAEAIHDLSNSGE